jgi:ATP-dependent RNA helicase DHX29
MRMLERTPDLAHVTHLVLDEVHERSIESDFLMVVLKRLLVKRKDLKYVFDTMLT